MCTLCDVTQNFDPTRHDGDSPVFADLTETTDAAASTDTVYSMSVGDTFQGEITDGDADWIEVQLEAGQSYRFDMQGAGGRDGLNSPILILRDGTGNQLDDNSTYDVDGGDRAQQMYYTAESSGTYYLDAQAENTRYSTDSGTYLVSMTEVQLPEVGTLDEMATYLLSDYWGGSERSFDTSSNNVITVNLTGLTADGRQLARWALQAWETVANLEFVEVRYRGDIRFGDHNLGAYASSQTTGDGTITSSYINISSGWVSYYGAEITSYAMSTYIHEIGHALGLGHQGGYNGSANYPDDATFLNDSYQLSVMSYFSQTDNIFGTASYGEPITPMMVDIIAIQQHYGAPGDNSPSAGDTIWGDGSTLGTYMDRLMTNGRLPYDPVVITIYDVSGTDLLNLGRHNWSSHIDLTPGSFSDVGLSRGSIAIARDTYIENVTLGAGNDTVIGNSADNVITTQAGSDSIRMGAGNDTGNGGEGADWIAGMSGDDLLSGSSGLDTLFGGAGQDLLIGGTAADLLSGGDGLDSLWGGTGHDDLFGGAGNDLLAGGSGYDTLWGNAGDDNLFGGAGNDQLSGGAGLDTLRGGTGNDALYGGGDRDQLFGGDGWDDLAGGDADDQLSGGNGHDRLNGGAGHDSLWGGNHNDTLFGGGGDDLLEGGAGNDSLDGYLNNDTLRGGAGLDTLVGGSGNDTLEGGTEDDALFGGAGQDWLNGGDNNDLLEGGNWSDTLMGGSGNDSLSDGQGNDVMEGDAGDDHLWFGTGNDTVTGGADADTFNFFSASGHDVITDLNGTEGDILRLHSNLWASSGALSEAQMLAQFASLNGNGVVTLSFDTGDSLTLIGITSLDGLGAVVEII